MQGGVALTEPLGGSTNGYVRKTTPKMNSAAALASCSAAVVPPSTRARCRLYMIKMQPIRSGGRTAWVTILP